MIRRYVYRVLALSGFLLVSPFVLAWIAAAWWQERRSPERYVD